jgi:hypothetical protein
MLGAKDYWPFAQRIFSIIRHDSLSVIDERMLGGLTTAARDHEHSDPLLAVALPDCVFRSSSVL